MSRYDQMHAAAKTYHAEHPEVWRMFVRFTNELIDRGFTHYAGHGVFSRIRWEADVTQGEGEFKINNNFSAFYARAFMKKYPEHEGFFRTRVQTSKQRDTVALPELTPDDYPYTNGELE